MGIAQQAIKQHLDRDSSTVANNHLRSTCRPAVNPKTVASGYQALDAQLKGGGWPLGKTLEMLSDGCGLGSMGLFLPAMEKLSSEERWQVFIAPPFTPYAPLLEARGIDTRKILMIHPQNRAELLSATEQALRSPTNCAVFSWLGAHEYRYSELHRLELAAACADGLSVMFRAKQAAAQQSAASLRLTMSDYRTAHILSQESVVSAKDIFLPTSEDSPQHPQLWEIPTAQRSPEIQPSFSFA